MSVNLDTKEKYKFVDLEVNRYIGSKLTKDEVRLLPIEVLYEIVMRGDIYKIFPQGTWDRPDAYSNAIKLIRYLLDKNNIDNDEIYERGVSKIADRFNYNVPRYIMKEFKYKYYSLFVLARPELKIYRFKKIPVEFWENTDDLREALEYFMSRDGIETTYGITSKLMVDSWGMKQAKLYYGGTVWAIKAAFPEVNIYEFDNKYFTKKDWTVEFSREALEYKMKKFGTDLDNLSVLWFREVGLRSLLNMCKGVNGVINYCYGTDYEPIKYRYSRYKVLEILEDYLKEVPTRENVLNLSYLDIMKILPSVYRLASNNRYNLCDWLFDSDFEYYSYYSKGCPDIVSQYEEILLGTRKRFMCRVFEYKDLYSNFKKIYEYLYSRGIRFDSYVDLQNYLVDNKLATLAVKINVDMYNRVLEDLS